MLPVTSKVLFRVVAPVTPRVPPTVVLSASVVTPVTSRVPPTEALLVIAVLSSVAVPDV